MIKALKIIGVVLLIGILISIGSTMDNTIGNLITIGGAVGGVAVIVQIIRTKRSQ